MYVLSNLDKEEQYILLQHITEGGRGKCAKKNFGHFK
jgi:hypothetical protein